jgi:hypothetical protein
MLFLICRDFKIQIGLMAMKENVIALTLKFVLTPVSQKLLSAFLQS